MTATLFEECATNNPNMSAEILHCISEHFERMEEQNLEHQASMRQWLFVFSGAMVFFMQAGFAMVCAGCIRKKNLHNSMLKNLLDVCGAAAAFYSVGYALAFGGQNERDDTTFIGTTNFFATGDVDSCFWFFQFALSATCVTIVAGTLAERCKMAAYLWYSLFLTGFVYPVTAHTLWSHNGVLSVSNAEPLRGIGVVDFAGSGVIHLTGGSIALVSTIILGARQGRFYDTDGKPLEKPVAFPGHSIAMQLLGTLILWFGWYGFNGGSALLLTNNSDSLGFIAARATANTSLSGAAGAISALCINLYFEYQDTQEFIFNLGMAMNGALSGLVAVTSGCGTIELFGAFLTGLVAGGCYYVGNFLLIRFKLDDVVNGIPVHFCNGLWGMIATGLFSSPSGMKAAYGTDEFYGLFYGLGSSKMSGVLLGNQFIGVLFILGWTIFTTTPFFLWLNHMGWFRSDGLEEVVGLDIRYHGGTNEGQEEVQEDLERYREQMRELQGMKKKPMDI